MNLFSHYNILYKGLEMWLSELGCHLQWVPVRVITASFPSQLPAKGLGKAATDGPGTWGPCHVCGGLGRSSWLLVLVWPFPGCYGHLGSEPIDQRLSVSSSHCNSAIQIHKIFKVLESEHCYNMVTIGYLCCNLKIQSLAPKG